MERKPGVAVLFAALTIFFSYLMVSLYLVLGGKWGTPGSVAVGVAYMFIAAAIAVVMQRVVYRQPVKGPLGISFKLNRWFLAGWLLPPAMALATMGVSLLLPGVSYSPEMAGMFEKYKDILTPEQLQQMQSQAVSLPVHPIWIALLQGLLAGITVNAVAGFGEELGWRGFLLKELEYLGFWKSSAVIGLFWGVWHAPLILQGHNYPQHPVAGVFMMTVYTLLLTPIFIYIRVKAKSVIAAAIAHGTLNGTMGLAVMVITGGNDLTVGGTGLAGFIVLAAVDLCILIFDRDLLKGPLRLTASP